MTTNELVYDVELSDFGSRVLICPMSPVGRAWIDANVLSEPWQWQCGALVCEASMARDIIGGMVRDGLEVSTIC